MFGDQLMHSFIANHKRKLLISGQGVLRRQGLCCECKVASGFRLQRLGQRPSDLPHPVRSAGCGMPSVQVAVKPC